MLFNLFYFYPDTDGRILILICEDDMKMRNRGLTFTVCGKINSYKKQLNYDKQTIISILQKSLILLSVYMY